LFHGSGEDGDGNHLGDFLAGFEFDGVVGQVGHDDKDFATVAGVDDATGGGEAAGGHGGTVTDKEAEGRAGLRVAGLDGDTGAEAEGGARGERYGFEAEDVVAEVFTGMGDDGQTRAGVLKSYAKHRLMVAERRAVARSAEQERSVRVVPPFLTQCAHQVGDS
jgi:hypothetical protein